MWSGGVLFLIDTMGSARRASERRCECSRRAAPLALPIATHSQVATFVELTREYSLCV